MGTLNILKVSGLSFSELSDPIFRRFREALRLPLPLEQFCLTLNRLETACRAHRGRLFFTLEKEFCKANIDLFYHPTFVLGADDDKMPTRSEALAEMEIKRTGGRTSRSFPTSDDVNTINGCWTIGRITQKKDSSSYDSMKRFIKMVKQATDQHEVPNLFLLDRGYDRAADLFSQWFGTLKKGSHCIFVEPTSRRPLKYGNQVEIIPEGLQVLYEYLVTMPTGKKQYQSAFLSNGTATYMTAPVGHDAFGSNLLGVWLAIPTRPHALTSQLPFCPLDRLPSGSKIYTSGQERDALWHIARSSCITSRTAYSLLQTVVTMRLPFLEDHSWILYFLGFNDFSPLPPCTFTAAQVTAFTQKKRLYDAMRSAGCTPSKNSAQLAQITLTSLKEEFLHFIQHPPPPPTAATLWKKLGPVMLASMLLKPLEGDKIKSLRLGIKNEQTVLERLKQDMNEKFLPQSSPTKVQDTYRIGLSAAPDAAANRMASSPDAIVEWTDGRICCVEVKSATGESTAAALEALASSGQKFSCAEFVDAELPPLAVVESELNEVTQTTAFVAQITHYSEVVPDKAHRVQILHHCSSLNLEHLLYVQADLLKTQRIRLVKYTSSILEKYRALIANILQILDYHTFADNLPFYPSTPASQAAADRLTILDTPQRRKPYYRDPFSVAQNFALGRLIRDMKSTPPSCSKIKPAKNHIWNIHKGHDDVASECKRRVAGNFHTPPAAYLPLRLLDTQTLNTLRSERVFLCLNRLENAPSVQHFRKILSRHLTLRAFLVDSASDFVTAFTFDSTPSSSTRSLIFNRLTDRYPSFRHMTVRNQQKLRLIANAELPDGEEDIATIWRRYILPHWPTKMTSTATMSCAKANCGTKPSKWCSVCQLPLCTASRTTNNCWFDLHSQLFAGTLDRYFASLPGGPKRSRLSSSLSSLESDSDEEE